MFPFWDLALAPLLEAARPRRMVEIGALRGENTRQLLDWLPDDCELHVIDPVPAFDPSEHEREFPGRYHFHRQLSHDALPHIPAVDVAFVDGDHNWYTVFHELRMLAEAARKADAPLPVIVLHDVGWPYGRRDLYYAPEQIPEEHRQPYEQRGMLRDRSELVDRGGLNPTMYNATHEGGPRNGVMTAVDDFLAGYDRPVRHVLLPVYFGLSILVDDERLAARPALGDVLDHLEGPEGQAGLALLAEDVRLEAMVVQHVLYYGAEERQLRSAKRYLDLLKGALLNEHYIEHELRIHQLVRSIENGTPAYGESLRDPARQWADQTRSMLQSRRAGKQADEDADLATYFPYTSVGRRRLDRLQATLDVVRTESVAGDLVECGTGRGGTAMFLRGYLEAHEMSFHRVWVADRFRAAPPGTTTTAPPAAEDHGVPGGGVGFPSLLADLNTVRDGFDRFGLLDGRTVFVQGDYAASLPAAGVEKISLLHIGETVRDEAGDILDALYDRVSVGGYVVIDRYQAPRCQKVVEEFRSRRSITDPMERVDWASSRWRKTSAGRRPTAADEPVAAAAGATHVPLAGPVGAGAVDLTVVVVFYDMKREARRTLHSLSRAYQQGLDDVSYEVIVLENGSHADQKLGAEEVASFGPEFRYVDIGDGASPSPVGALNRGVAEGRGRNFALMIDGAHVLTPGVLRHGLDGLRTYAPAIVATQQWYVGPGDQSEVIAEGYDQQLEDELFDRISWPRDGYRLFDIGHFIGDRDWLDGMWESNCLFVPRALLQRFGAFDEAFSMPGGGYANLDIYERLGSSPDVTIATILGEGSFHQLHGGTTTNRPGMADRHFNLADYGQHFEEERGRPFRGNRKQIHYVGTMRPDAARTRPRRRSMPNLFRRKKGEGRARLVPTPLPHGLRRTFLDAYWHTLKWRSTSWLGQRVPKSPTDLFAYQELLAEVRPDWVVETGTGNGGRALFLATICDLLDHGRILSIDPEVVDGRPEHPRIRYVTGSPTDRNLVAEVHRTVGQDRALVILGSRGSAGKTITEFRLYEDLVPKGSYVVVEDTIVNGHPVLPEFGPGPAEAVKGVVESRGDFAPDERMAKYPLSFNHGGFLRRLR